MSPQFLGYMAKYVFLGHPAKIHGKKKEQIAGENQRKLMDVLAVEFLEDCSIVFFNQRIGNFSLMQNEEEVAIRPRISGAIADLGEKSLNRGCKKDCCFISISPHRWKH